jgi:pSer/pThr/pTyr-binding forkhead associated (FHA) protein
MATITIIFAGQEEKTVQLDKPKLVVGREPSCDIPIDNLGISRQHCAFVQRGEAFVVQDLGSSNGTFINGQRITEHYLNNDDEVIIGKYTLKFKNTAQATAPAQGGGVAIPDTLNTYVVEGGKIQEQLAKIRAQSQQSGGTAKDYARALETGSGKQPEVQKLKAYIAALATAVVILLIVLTLMMAGIIKI